MPKTTWDDLAAANTSVMLETAEQDDADVAVENRTLLIPALGK